VTESLTTYQIGKHGLEVEVMDDGDPRGLFLVWEPPQATCNYVVSSDPTMGIQGWNRALRSDRDAKHDNAAVEVWRVGSFKDGEKQPDVQVAEWAGPLDAEDLAYILNFIGRLYGGNHEDQQALMAIEVWPGPGWLTQRVMHDQLGYTRFPPWLKEGRQMTQWDTGHMGWRSSASTRRDLWIRSGGHIRRRRAVIHSKWFVEEMVACTPDNFLSLTAQASRVGFNNVGNDDRVVAGLIGLWFCNEWIIGQEPTEPTPVQKTDAPDWQLSAVSFEEMMQSWDERVRELQD
jgi:hypothetical protein